MEFGIDFKTFFCIEILFLRNSLTSQEVIDFVNDHIDTIPLKKIGSEVFYDF